MKYLFVLLALALPALADAPKTPAPLPVPAQAKPWDGFPPSTIQTPEPPLIPSQPKPVGMPQLNTGQLYVVNEPDADATVVLSPEGICTGKKHPKGAVSIGGVFVGRPSGEFEYIEFSGQCVFAIWPASPKAKGEVDVIVSKIVSGAIVHTRQRITVNQAPQPPPQPIPPIPPIPPSPAPPIEGVRLLMVWDDNKALPAGQHSIIYGKTVREYLDRKCPEYRIWPDATKDGYADSKEFGDAFKRPRASLPWVVLGNGKTGTEGPLPKTVDQMMTLLKQYYGE